MITVFLSENIKARLSGFGWCNRILISIVSVYHFTKSLLKMQETALRAFEMFSFALMGAKQSSSGRKQRMFREKIRESEQKWKTRKHSRNQ